MGIQAAEISAILKEQIKNFGKDAEVAEVGRVLSVGDGIARVHGTEATGARADIAHQHDGSRTGAPAFADVGALGLFAHGRQLVLPDDARNGIKSRAAAHANAQPVGLLRARTRRGGGLDAVLDGRDALRRHVLLAAARGVLDDRYAFELAHVRSAV